LKSTTLTAHKGNLAQIKYLPKIRSSDRHAMFRDKAIILAQYYECFLDPDMAYSDKKLPKFKWVLLFVNQNKN
jgi:hypothetical protein